MSDERPAGDPGVTRIERPAWDRGPDDPAAGERASWEGPGSVRVEWQTFEVPARRRIPVLGIVLLVLGGALLVDQLSPISFSAILLGALTAAFAAAWIGWRARWAVTPMIVMAALFLPDLLGDLGILVDDGWTSISLAIAFAIVWLIDRSRGRLRRWPLWLAGILGLIGVIQLSDQLPWLPDIDAFWPLVFIGVGLLFILDTRGRRPPG